MQLVGPARRWALISSGPKVAKFLVSQVNLNLPGRFIRNNVLEIRCLQVLKQAESPLKDVCKKVPANLLKEVRDGPMRALAGWPCQPGRRACMTGRYCRHALRAGQRARLFAPELRALGPHRSLGLGRSAAAHRLLPEHPDARGRADPGGRYRAVQRRCGADVATCTPSRPVMLRTS